MSAQPKGFSFIRRKSGEVIISHNGRVATTLRNYAATDFIEDMDGTDHDEAQEIMARLTGNYRRGNERQAKAHPRNV